MSDLLESLVSESSVESLTDDEVLALSEMMMPTEQDEALSNLLADQREGRLDAERQRRLAELMQIYEQGLLKKSQALRIAVERGLREQLRF